MTLDAITTKASTLAPRRSAELNFQIIKENVSEVVLVSDDEMQEAAQWLWQTAGIATELSAAAAIAAVHTEKIRPSAKQKLGIVICGSGTDGLE